MARTKRSTSRSLRPAPSTRRERASPRRLPEGAEARRQGRVQDARSRAGREGARAAARRDDRLPRLQVRAVDQRPRVLLLATTRTRFDVKFEPIGDWPMADESIGTRDVASHAKLRRADPEMLRTAFRRCHNFIHGNEGMPKDAAFWQFLYLIFAKMHDERQPNDARASGRAPPSSSRSRPQGHPQADPPALRGGEEEVLDHLPRQRGDHALRPCPRLHGVELAKYDFGRTDVDAKGAAYQEIVGTNLRGDRGQYFTPRGAIKLVVPMLDPEAERARARPCVRHRRVSSSRRSRTSSTFQRKEHPPAPSPRRSSSRFRSGSPRS